MFFCWEFTDRIPMIQFLNNGHDNTFDAELMIMRSMVITSCFSSKGYSKRFLNHPHAEMRIVDTKAKYIF